MTRKDYEVIAGILNNAKPEPGTTSAARIIAADTVRNIAEDFAKMLAADNPHFDRARFLKACGME